MAAITEFLTDSRKLVFVLGGLIAVSVFVAFIFILGNFGGGPGAGEEVTLTVWGVFDDSVAFDAAIKSFGQQYKNVAVTYTMLPPDRYENALLNALAAGTGPDVFMIHHTWLPKFQDKLRYLPAEFPALKGPLMTERQFRDTFVDVAAFDLVSAGRVWAMPLYMDTLAMFYNRDLLSQAGIARPARTWSAFLQDVPKVTTVDVSRNITRPGAAIGTARNINRSTDALMMLMLQSGVRMANEDNTQATFADSVDGQPVGEIALQFYTDFAKPSKDVYTWNDTQDYSIDAFTSGRLAFLFNYSHQIALIRERAPRMNWAVAPVPQATDVESRTYANYWPLAVGLQSKHPYEAWQFVHHMAVGAGTVPYLNETGRPAARRDLIEQQASDPDLGVFAEQALNARSWYQIDNLAIEKIFAEMIDAVNLSGEAVRDALRAGEAKVTVLLSQ